MLTIRHLKAGDVKSISILAKESFTMPWSEQAFANLVQDQNSLFLVALEDQKLVGGCGLTHIVDEGDIHNVMVSADCRGRGIGTEMLECLLEEGKARGIREFTLEVRVSNQAAIHLYEKLGFASEGIRPGFYEEPVEDALIMWKRQITQ